MSAGRSGRPLLCMDALASLLEVRHAFQGGGEGGSYFSVATGSGAAARPGVQATATTLLLLLLKPVWRWLDSSGKETREGNPL